MNRFPMNRPGRGARANRAGRHSRLCDPPPPRVRLSGHNKSEAAEDELDAFKSRVGTIVKDPYRAKQLVIAVDDAVTFIKDLDESTALYQEHVRLLNANYDATVESFRALMTERDDSLASFRFRLFALRDRILEVTSPRSGRSSPSIACRRSRRSSPPGSIEPAARDPNQPHSQLSKTLRGSQPCSGPHWRSS